MAIIKFKLEPFMTQNYKWSFLITIALIFLTPLFFIPGGALALEAAKSALFSIGIVIAVLVYLLESWRQGSLSFPRHYFLIAVCLLPAVYLLSSLLSTPSSLSLLGYNLEVGTFGYILLGSAALLLSASMFTETGRFLQALVALFASFSILALFMVVQILTGGDFLTLGNFSGNMGNPLGNWTDLAVVFGLLSILSALAIGMIPMKAAIRALLYAVFVVSTALLVILGFSTAFMLTFGASILLYFYFRKIERNFLFHPMGERGEMGEKGNFFTRPTFLPILLGLISLVFMINPTISETRGNLSNVVSGTFSIQNSDVRPTFSATLGISKAVLSEAGLLGSGPNTFGHDWLIYKPLNINATPFWGVAFPFGVGFLPTQIATTGILGTIIWIGFFALLLVLLVKVLSRIPESRALRFTLITTLFVSLFLWTSSFLYSPSGAVLILAFIFTGIFTAILRETGIVPSYTIDLREATPTRFVAMVAVVAVALGALSMGWIGAEKTLAAYHFKRAIDLSNTEGALIADVENELIKAIEFDPVDTHFVALSRLNFSKAQAAANAATGTPEQNRAIFEDGLRRSIEASRAAVTANPASYENWVSLGLIYSALVPEPLKVDGAYDNARFAYSEAMKRNPNNPELPLFLAQLELNNENVEAARSYIRNSIALKEDYADAYLLLAQLEIREKNIAGAIESTEVLAILAPQNPGVHFELGVLKYSNRDFEGAVESLTEAVKLSPQYANAKFYLGLTFYQLGRREEAKNQFEDLLATNPGNAEIMSALKALDESR